MPETKSNTAHTHAAFAFRREGKKSGRWLEVGTARAEAGGTVRVFLDRLPIGGFSGGILLSPLGTRLSEPAPVAQAEDEPDDAGA